MRMPWVILTALCCLASSFASPRAAAQSFQGFATADIGVTLETLDYSVDGDFVENLVRVTAVNHGPSDVSSFVIATCLSDPWPVDVVDDFAGGCNSYGLVVPCTEFGLGFRFGDLAHGESAQCLARIRGSHPSLPIGLQLAVGRLIDGAGESMADPNPANDTIELNPTGIPPAGYAAVPGLSVAPMLALTCLLVCLARRRMRREFRGR